MRNFISTTPETVIEQMGEHAAELAGILLTPFARRDLDYALELGIPFALDNGCFRRYDPAKIISMLRNYQGLPGCTFAVLPDVVCNHAETLTLFREWLPRYQAMGYPPAFVLQNGVSPDTVPYDDVSALFIGGDTAFKFSLLVRDIARIAKGRGLWIHMGRVNSERRIRYAASIGCDSFDGTGYSKFSKTVISKHVPAMLSDVTIHF